MIQEILYEIRGNTLSDFKCETGVVLWKNWDQRESWWRGWCCRACWSQNQESCINCGLNLNIRTQNSIWESAPSPSRSPSLIMLASSSSLKSCNPIAAEFFLKLSNVITPLSLSISTWNPLHSSSIKPSPPSLPAITGNKSSNSTSFPILAIPGQTK